MQVISEALAEILKAKLQAGTSGFRARIEIDRVSAGEPGEPTTGTAWTDSIMFERPVTPVTNLGGAGGIPGDPDQVVDGLEDFSEYPSWAGAPAPGDYHKGWAVALDGVYEVERVTLWDSGQVGEVVRGYLEGVEVVEGGSFADTNPDGWDSHTSDARTWTFDSPVIIDEIRVLYEWTADGGAMGQFSWTMHEILAHGIPQVAEGTVVTDVVAPLEVSIDKSLQLDADQADVLIPNEAIVRGWGDTIPWPTNCRIRIFQWYGVAESAIRTFTGVIDAVDSQRDPTTIGLTCRDMFAVLIDDRWSAIAPQAEEEEDADRTEDNGVYLGREVDYIVSDQLDRAGFPVADRAISETSFVLEEYVVPDGASRAEVIATLAGMVGYSAWCDELGVFHFAPTFTAGALLDPPEPAYTFRAGEDIVHLGDTTDQHDLVTRVKTRGPLATLKDAWAETWRTRKITRPLDVWHAPDNPGQIHVLDKATKRLYRLRQSDRKILGYTSLGGVIDWPAAVSGDPDDADRYWVASLPGQYDEPTTDNKLYKINRNTGAVVDEFNLPNGDIKAVKVSADYVWFTRADTDRIYQRDKSDLSAIDSWQLEWYPGEAGIGSVEPQTQPRGLMIDGTTIWSFWTNGERVGRWLLADESDPEEVTHAVYMSGSRLFATEIDTTDSAHAWGVHPANGIVAKFRLVEPFNGQVYAEVVDTELEHELGELAQLEPRVHDTHPGDADHPFQVRRDTVELQVVLSLAQATEVSARQLELKSRRRRVVDVGILGNPAIQKTDVIRVEDPISGLERDFTLDTYRSRMDETYLGTLALIPIDVVDDEFEEDGELES